MKIQRINTYVLPICSATVSFGLLPSLWLVCTRMNMLSTPTASTKNGITSMMINVAETPAKPKIPTEHTTDANTMNTPEYQRYSRLFFGERNTYTTRLRRYLIAQKI